MIGPNFLDGMDEEDTLGLGVAGSAPASTDLMAQLLALQGDLAKSQSRGRELRQQQLQQATETLKTRRFGPSLSEQLFALSAAFAQPTRHKGLGSVLANVMPVLGQSMSARRQGKMAKEDAILELQNKYALGTIDDEQQGIADRIKLLSVAARAQPKAEKPKPGFNPVTGKLVDMNTGLPILPGVASPTSREEYEALPAGTEYLAPDGKVRRKSGGPTGSAPSGGFRP